jgi:multidrug resistance efflux pump
MSNEEYGANDNCVLYQENLQDKIKDLEQQVKEYQEFREVQTSKVRELEKKLGVASENFGEYVYTHDQGIMERSDDSDLDIAERAWQAATIASEKKHQDNIAGIINQIKIRDKEILDLQKEREEMKAAILELDKGYEFNTISTNKLIEKLKGENGKT